MHRAPMPAPLPDDEPAHQDDHDPMPGIPSDDEPVPDHNPSRGMIGQPQYEYLLNQNDDGD